MSLRFVGRILIFVFALPCVIKAYADCPLLDGKYKCVAEGGESFSLAVVTLLKRPDLILHYKYRENSKEACDIFIDPALEETVTRGICNFLGDKWALSFPHAQDLSWVMIAPMSESEVRVSKSFVDREVLYICKREPMDPRALAHEMSLERKTAE